MVDEALVRLRGVAKDYKRGAETVHVLHALDLDTLQWRTLAPMPQWKLPRATVGT